MGVGKVAKVAKMHLYANRDIVSINLMIYGKKFNADRHLS